MNGFYVTEDGCIESDDHGVRGYYADGGLRQARKRDLAANHAGLRMPDIADGKNRDMRPRDRL